MQLIMGELSREVKQNPSGSKLLGSRKNSRVDPIEAQITKNLIQEKATHVKDTKDKGEDPYEESSSHLASRFGKSGEDSEDGEEVLRGDKQLQKSKIQQKLK
eukprot:CAMPEP_0170489670 /NCGR_PEP_ID=MMETSP0208-20121228/7977_1 /TAXON_ID=197538 /ORGANISM="Strombidium inclinatum, Strain S3" /LENGTH=101 /DNA_ID=CAMNT_0010764679 /DNA_START=39 /DNA_END=341 /DNA_ORIENTATION=-